MFTLKSVPPKRRGAMRVQHEVLASIIRRGLMDGQQRMDAEQNKGELVLVGPSVVVIMHPVNQLASLDGVWLGHMLATYALPFEKTEVWTARSAGDSPFVLALDATRQAFPGGSDCVFHGQKSVQGVAATSHSGTCWKSRMYRC